METAAVIQIVIVLIKALTEAIPHVIKLIDKISDPEELKKLNLNEFRVSVDAFKARQTELDAALDAAKSNRD